MVAVSFFFLFVLMFLGELHVLQQDRYSVWAQSTELGRVLCYYTPLCCHAWHDVARSVLLWRLLTPRRTPCLRKYFSKACVLGMAASVHGGNQEPKRSEFRTTLKCHLLQFTTRLTRFYWQQIMLTWSEEILD